jgi:hypothetical protein
MEQDALGGRAGRLNGFWTDNYESWEATIEVFAVYPERGL